MKLFSPKIKKSLIFYPKKDFLMFWEKKHFTKTLGGNFPSSKNEKHLPWQIYILGNGTF